ncbi:Aste57867_23769 [Aphanomyces stellatus]|uniref:Aste57867_23769 protein n=1 Tax=Aphanomyces stellatus TaxID=120398 RepID=A0A485LNW1_9STRA|nr:hypothetical protein As57867_023696 [Aphanomyces stellatus]VFU00414.1 Aste57867_23769 [Aphanomyces stellatus]
MGERNECRFYDNAFSLADTGYFDFGICNRSPDMPLTVRPAHISDVDAILHGANQAFMVYSYYKNEGYRARFTEEDIRGLMTAPDSLIFVAEDDTTGRLCGCIHVAWETTPTGTLKGMLGKLCAFEGFEGRGVGTRLTQAAEAHVMQQSECGDVTMELFVISVMKPLFAYYEKQGYRLQGRTYDPPIFDAMVQPAFRDQIFLVYMDKVLAR